MTIEEALHQLNLKEEVKNDKLYYFRSTYVAEIAFKDRPDLLDMYFDGIHDTPEELKVAEKNIRKELEQAGVTHVSILPNSVIYEDGDYLYTLVGTMQDFELDSENLFKELSDEPCTEENIQEFIFDSLSLR